MYPDISPDLKIKTTISNPLDPASVYGFTARNTMLGRTAIVLKELAVNDGRVLVPPEPADVLLNEDSELVVLDGDVVLTMEGTDFATEHQLHTVEGGGRTSTMNFVNRDNDKFLSWAESMVEVGN
jgi:hypothetical protein